MDAGDPRARRPSIRLALIKAKTGAKIGIGEHIKDVQRIFRPVFDAGDLRTDGSEFDHLFKDGEHFKIGALRRRSDLYAGHTPADITYKIGDAAFVGDTMFMPDYGTARADFPGGDAHQLYRSIRKSCRCRSDAAVHVPRLQGAGPQVYAWETTVGEERERNVHVKEGVSEDAFVANAQARDATLSAPDCCCRRSRSTFARENFRPPMPTA